MEQLKQKLQNIILIIKKIKKNNDNNSLTLKELYGNIDEKDMSIITSEPEFVKFILSKKNDSDYVLINEEIENNILIKLRKQLNTNKNYKIYNKHNSASDTSDKYFLRNNLGDAYYDNLIYNGHTNFPDKGDKDDKSNLPVKHFVSLKRNYLNSNEINEYETNNFITINNQKSTDVVRYCSTTFTKL